MKTGYHKTMGQYNKHRRKLQRERERRYWNKQRDMRETNRARIADGRGYKGGETYAGAEAE